MDDERVEPAGEVEHHAAVKSAGRNSQLARILQVLRDLDRQGGADLYELAQRYGTAVRTIRRDLQALQGAGLPLVEDTDAADSGKKRWRIAYREKLSQISGLLDAGHYLALRVAMDGGVRRRTSLFTSLEDLADKIEGAVGASGRKKLEQIHRAIHSWEKFTYERASPDVLWPLVTAINEQRLCRVHYSAIAEGDGEKTFRVLPLKILAYDQALYVHVYVPKHKAVIVLNLQRLRALEVLAEKEAPPADYDAEKLAQSTFGVFIGKQTTRYRLRFPAYLAKQIGERSWHPSQKVKKLRDGGVELELTCYESPEVDAWVRSYGADVDVLEPASLRGELVTMARRLLERYTTT